MYRNTFLLMILALHLITFACKTLPDVSQFISKESFLADHKRCKGSSDEHCELRPPLQKVEEFCSTNNLTKENCDEYKKAVIQKATEYMQELLEQMKEEEKVLKKLSEKVKGLN